MTQEGAERLPDALTIHLRIQSVWMALRQHGHQRRLFGPLSTEDSVCRVVFDVGSSDASINAS